MPKFNELFQSGYLPVAIEWMGEQIPGGFFIYRADETSEIVYVNNAVLRIYGCETIEEFRKLTGNTFRGMVHPKDYADVAQSIEKQIKDVDHLNLDYIEYRIIRRDGVVRWVDDYGHFAQFPGYGDVYAVLMDVRMPVMDGLETTSAIRALPRKDAQTVPIIALTANAFDEDVQQSLQSGMTAHLSKPVEPPRLYQTLEELMN